MLKHFKRGGVHPADNKISRDAAIEAIPLPDTVFVPLSQHIGAPAAALVAKGDKVLAGQLIAKAAGFVSANVHSPVSGTVLSVDNVADAGGQRRPMVAISVEGDEWTEGIDRSPEIVKECALTPEEIIAKIEAAGLVGMGGATFPTHVKLKLPPGKKCEYLIINGVECEPWLTSDHRLMIERGEELMVGIKILAKALGAAKSYVGIENNKPDAISRLAALTAADPSLEIVPLRVRYPQGGEKQLIDAILGREVPSGGLPIDVGVVVQNVGTALAVYEAVQKNKPLVERVVTVTGKTVQKPSNLLVRVGTPLSALFERCGGIPVCTSKIVAGGTMMGRAISNPDAPVTKGSSGFVAVPDSYARRAPEKSCVKCARCVGVCPMGLEPYYLYKVSRASQFEMAEAAHATDCIECGSCAYTCPSSLPLLDILRIGKAEAMKIARAKKN